MFSGDEAYPRPSGRGSIEAQLQAQDTQATPAYPRPSGRGSIEALTARGRHPLGNTIHVHQDVAPLKRY